MLLGLQSDEAYEEYLAAMEKKDIEYAWFNGNTGEFDWSQLTLQNLFANGYHLKVKALATNPTVTVQDTIPHTGSTTVTPVQPLTQITYTNVQAVPINGSNPQMYSYQGERNGVTEELATGTSQAVPSTLSVNVDGYNYQANVTGTTLTFNQQEYDFIYPVGSNIHAALPVGLQNYSYQVGTQTYNIDLATGEVTYETIGSTTVTLQVDEGDWIECDSVAKVKAALNAPNLDSTDASVLRDLIYNAYAIIMDEIYDPDTGNYPYTETSVATNVGLREKTNDKELAKAEAEYEAAMRRIDKKEEEYDKDLAKYDQERKALTTQLDTLKTCIKDNIDRTFKIFQG